jgi:filamentous hemagglutinin
MNLNEQLAMRQAVVDPASGTRLPFVMGDSRWPASEGWIKMSQNNLGVEIHYVYNVETGASADFKFVP